MLGLPAQNGTVPLVIIQYARSSETCCKMLCREDMACVVVLDGTSCLLAVHSSYYVQDNVDVVCASRLQCLQNKELHVCPC